MRIWIGGPLAAITLALAGCDSSGGGVPSEDLDIADGGSTTADQSFVDCYAGDPGALAGQNAEEARQAHTTGPVRVIPPGSLVTQDYDPKRLNLVTDAMGIVVRIYCG